MAERTPIQFRRVWCDKQQSHSIARSAQPQCAASCACASPVEVELELRRVGVRDERDARAILPHVQVLDHRRHELLRRLVVVGADAARVVENEGDVRVPAAVCKSSEALRDGAAAGVVRPDRGGAAVRVQGCARSRLVHNEPHPATFEFSLANGAVGTKLISYHLNFRCHGQKQRDFCHDSVVILLSDARG